MPISLAVPLQRAWGRMERMLFRPFRLRTWFVLGFAAFLSEYLSGRRPSQFGWREHGHAPWHGAGAWTAGVFGNPVMIVAVIFMRTSFSSAFAYSTTTSKYRAPAKAPVSASSGSGSSFPAARDRATRSS